MRERRISAQDGLSLYFRDYGDPQSPLLPLLCLSGLTRNSRDFEPLAERLAAERRVLCPDYRGRGQSAWDPEWRHYEPLTYINDALHVLAAADVGRAVIVGSSMGGLLAMGIAAIRPTAVAGVVMNDIGPDVAPDGLGRILAWISADRPQPDWASAEQFLRRTLRHLPIDDAHWRRLTRGTFREMPDGSLRFDWDVGLVKPLLRGDGQMRDLWQVFRALRRIPVLVLRGIASDVLTEGGVARMVEAKPDLVHVTIPGAGHAPALDEPESKASIDEFLARF
jgi:pimeloyl-ACP methyl ester carboxylesterase